MQEKYGIIYLITNTINNKKYVGQTIFSSNDRWNAHKSGRNSYLKYAIEKHGENSFNVKDIDTAENQKELNEKEVHWISFYNTTDHRFGYNILFGGGSGPLPDETRKKISKSEKGKKLSEIHKKKISESQKGKRHWNYGKHRSDETKKKISESMKGRISWNKGTHLSDKTRKKISESLKGRIPWNYKKHFSKETKQKLSKAKEGKKNPMYGKHHTEQTKKKISKANKGKIPWNKK